MFHPILKQRIFARPMLLFIQESGIPGGRCLYKNKQTKKKITRQGFSRVIFIGQHKVHGTNCSRQVALWLRPVPGSARLSRRKIRFFWDWWAAEQQQSLRKSCGETIVIYDAWHRLFVCAQVSDYTVVNVILACQELHSNLCTEWIPLWCLVFFLNLILLSCRTWILC